MKNIACDFLACSPYKFFGPHSGLVGHLWGMDGTFGPGFRNHQGFFDFFRYLKWRNPKKLVCLGPKWWFQRFIDFHPVLLAPLFFRHVFFPLQQAGTPAAKNS